MSIDITIVLVLLMQPFPGENVSLQIFLIILVLTVFLCPLLSSPLYNRYRSCVTYISVAAELSTTHRFLYCVQLWLLYDNLHLL